ncbi:mucin-binding protein [Lactobacillus gallinarum]|uniref:mucin-binding protein n=1 Tax=Lactobacillus gallinarum TaxID=52242 RepID=UPI00242FDA09|nr:YSIRK-type signal peptide-containing protein [Lactobacillus gallinarum]
MLFNKHAETKQRFGIRKLTIGATSVLLSTLFLTINNSQKAQAATAENVSSTSNNSNLGQEDSKTASEQNVTDQNTDNTQNPSTNQNRGGTTDTNNTVVVVPSHLAEKITQATETANLDIKKNETASNKEVTGQTSKDDAQNKLADENKLVAKKAAAVNMKFAVRLAARTSTPVLSQDSHDKNMNLSINSPELSNKTYDPEVITLNATNVHAGDKIVIKVKKGSAYDLTGENLPIGTVTSHDQDDYRVYELNITASGKFAYKITAKKKSNYHSQPAPMPDTGVTDKDIQWSINDQDQAPLSFKQTIIPQLTADTIYIASSNGLAYGAPSNTIKQVIPNQDYNFGYILRENDGIIQDGSYSSMNINSAVNYGSTITIPVPENFLLNHDATIKANTELGLIDKGNADSQITITQAGIGQDIIITVPKGKSQQGSNGAQAYALTGKFVYDKDKLPEHDTPVAAKRHSFVDQIYTADGQKIHADGGIFKATIAGSDDQPEIGSLDISAKGAINSNELLLDSNPTNDPKVVNWFAYKNNNDDIKDAKIQLDLADGLHVTGIKTPKDLGTIYNNIGNIKSYTYEITLTNGKKVTGTVTAGETVSSTDNVGIRSITLTPDTRTIGRNTKTDGLPNVGKISDQTANLSQNLFIAYGNLNDTYDDGTKVKVDDKLTSSITIFGSNFKSKPDGKKVVSYTASGTQTIIDSSKFTASLGTWTYQPHTNPGWQSAGEISLNGGGSGNYSYIYEPIFYYVVPGNAVFSGNSVDRLNKNGNQSPSPIVTSYLVNGHQIVKVDYTGTNYQYNTATGANDSLHLDNANNQTGKTLPWEVYIYSKDIKIVTNGAKGQFLTASDAEKFGSSLKLDPNKFYYIGGGNWTTATASAVVMADAANGNKTNGLYFQQASSDDKGTNQMSFRVNVVNYDTVTDLHNAIGFVNLPTIGYNNSTLNFSLSGPVDANDQTVLYSTTTTDLPIGVGTATPSTDHFLTEEQVRDEIAKGQMSWSDVKSIAVKYDVIKANTATKDIYIYGTDKNIAQDAGKVGKLAWGLYGGNGMPPLVNKNASKITVSGTSTIDVRLHYKDPDEKDQYINVPSMSKKYNDNVNAMNESDFSQYSIPTKLIPKGYELVLKDGQAVKSIINNGGNTWTTDAPDGSAQFGKTVIYNFDHDTVQFELKPKIDEATQSIKHVVHFVTDDSSAHQLFDDQAVDVTVTQATNEVTGKKTYAALYMENGKKVDLSVTKLDDGQISITFPAATIPSSKEYYVVDNTKDQASALTHTFTFTANSNPTIENTVKYAPVKQELQVKVYDDDSETPKEVLDTKDTGATVDFIGNSNTAFPGDLQTNLDKLKTYYEAKHYIVTLPSASGNFDDTVNGPDKDNKVQVIEVHLTHAKAVKTEQVNAVRNVTYSGAGDLTPAEKTDTAEDVFSRTVTTDLVTNKVTNFAWTGSHTFAGVDTLAVAGYHADKAVAGNIEVTADKLNNADEATLAELMKNGVVVSDHVTYAPDHQELKIRVHDDTTNQDLSPVTAQSDLIKEHGTTVAISADGHTDEATPADFSNNIDELKKYYESKGYKIVSTSEVPTKFDNTSNGDSLTDKTPQYVDIHLEHALKLEKESKEVTRTINFYDQDQNKLIHDANPNLPQYPQTVTQVVKFDRYIVRDQVTSQIIGYATPSQVTVDNTDQAQLAQKDGYTHATGESNDKTAGFVSPASYGKYNNYDLSRYGYEAPTDVHGNSYSQVAAATPKATDSDSVVNVYYREKVVTVTVDNPPTPGTPIVPGSDVRYPKNDWDKQTATSESTRTIHYIYDNNTFVNGKDVSGQPVPGLHDIKQTVTYAQSATINLVTGEVNYQGDWKPYSSSTTNQKGEVTTTKDSNSYAEVVSPNYKTNPSLTGYTPHQEVVNAAKATHGANASDVFVRYVANNSLVQVEYVDKDTGDTLKVDKKTGKSGETFTYSTADLIKEYEKQGYELVHDGYTANDGDLNQSAFDSYDVPDGQYPAEIKQKWTVSLKHKKITVTSDQPKDSTEKITTPDGYDHNYPSGVGQSDLNNTVKRTISFIYTDKPAGHNQAFPSVDQDVSYKRDATIDLVKLGKGEKDAVTYSNWEPAEAGKESFDKNEVKVVLGYIADYEVVPSQDILKDENGKAKDGQNIVVKYSPVGKIIPVDKNGAPIPNAPTPSYNNDPKNPTRITNTPVPEIPGYHAEISEVTPDPNKPGENTRVVYVKNKQTIDLTYVDTTTNKTLTTQTNVAQGDSDSAIPASVTDTLKATEQSYLDKGYVVDDSKTPATVPTNFDSSSQNPDGTDAEHQVVTVYLKHDKETITGDDPKNPRDPINEKDPNGAKYPPEASKSNLTISSQNIVHYEGTGEQTPKDSVVTDDNTLTRTVTIDKVTGDVLETSAWQGEKDYENVATPVVNGYFADKKAAGESKVTTADVDRAKDGVITNETTVVYKPMGKIIPVDKNRNPIPNSPTPIFNNDTQDPTKASKTDTPEISGYHLEKSDETVITPDNPGKVREVVYVADSQKVLIKVYDKDSKTPDQPLDTSKTNIAVDFTGDSFTNFPTGAATSVDDLIKYYKSRGYKVENKPTAEELAAKFDGDQTVDQYLKLTLVHDTETITGENPKKVGDPINPADPDSKKYDKQTSKENLVIASEVIIEYAGAGDKTPTKSVRTNDATLTRSVTIDKVTGAVISTNDWTGGANYDDVTTPTISGYTADLESAGKAAITPADYNDAVNGVITRKLKVVYTPEKQELQLKVYDQDTGKYLDATESFFGVTDQDIDQTVQTSLDKLKEQFTTWGYEIVKTPDLDKTYDNTINGTSEIDKHPQEFVLVVKHRHETVTPDDPKTPKDNIPDTNQNYPKGVDEADLTKKITRTITVHFPDGSTKEISQDVIYVRTATVDVVTKDVTYSEWTSKDNKWPEFKAPDVPGYVPDTAKVDLVLVKDTDTNTKVDIYYTLDTSMPSPLPTDPETQSPQNPNTDTKTDQDTTKPEQNQEVNKTNQTEHETKTEHKTRTKQTHAKKQKTVQSTKTYRAKSASVVNSNKSKSSTPGLVNAPKAKKLPQTNSSSGWQTSLLGVGLLFMSLLVFKKKKKDD